MRLFLFCFKLAYYRLSIEKFLADYRFPLPTIPFLMKIFFLFCYPHTLTIRLKRPVYRGFSGEGKCEGKLSPLTLALTPQSVLNPSYAYRIKRKIRLKSHLSRQGTIII